MRLFSCQSCSQILFFENVRCERCAHTLGYLPETARLHALVPAPDSTGDTWNALGTEIGTFRLCANAAYGVCNWLVGADAGTTALCAACRHNRVIPELGDPEHWLAWRRIEVAKHRLFYSLYRLGLVRAVDTEGANEPLTFRFLADMPNTPGPKVMTGHDNGVITIAISEADDAEREKRRKLMNEPYRTLIGHFRHEVGHYFWDKLVRDRGQLEACRAVFGDDRRNYEAALQRHYQTGAPSDWQNNYVSSYATCHPWEDFAETWAHYLHIVDTLELAQAYDLRLAPAVDKGGEYDVNYAADPYAAPDIHALIKVWLPVSTALNTFNRTMGKDELYPFVLSPGVIEKLGYMHQLLRSMTASASPT